MINLKDTFLQSGTNPIAAETYTGPGGLGNLISAILPNALIVSGFILFLYLIFGGFMLITAGSDPKKAEAGKSALTNAIIGFVIIFTSFWIIQIIEIITGLSILN